MKKWSAGFLLFFSVLGLYAQSYSIAQSTGAPQGFNYNSPADTLIISQTADVLSARVSLPFPFVFFGDTVFAYKASDNGYITFDSSASISYPANDLPPSAGGPNHAIYAFWDDLSVPANVGMRDIVKAWTYGNAPNRTHAVQWYSVTPTGTGEYLYCTVLLQECGGFEIVHSWSNSGGRTGTVGCENQSGTQAVVVTGSPNLGMPSLGSGSADDIVYTFSLAGLANEVSVQNLVSPTTAGMGSYTVSAEIFNGGNIPLQSMGFYYSINGGPSQNSTLTLNSPSQSVDTVVHPLPWTPAGPGTYTLCVWTSLPNGQPDPIACNDTLCFTVVIAAFDPNCGSIKVVVLGSSTAAGSGPSTQDSAWVWRYRRYLEGLNPANQVINYGIGGTTTYHIMPDFFIPPSGRPNPNTNQNITRALAQNPDAIIVNMPSNDAATGVPAAETIANFDSLFSMAEHAGVKMYICTTQPRNFSASGIATQIVVRDYVLNTFGPFALDFWNPFATPGGTINPIYDSGDGVHMNDQAHALLSQKVENKGLLQDVLFPIAQFSYQNTGATYQFSDLSEGATNWYWDFGDGRLDSTASPQHTYATGGGFFPCLVVENGCARDTICDSFSVCLPPVASLISLDQGARRFDFSTQTPGGIAWFWDFGDGTFSNDPNPTHVYSADGTFTVCLTFTDTCSRDTVCQTVQACQEPIAFFTYSTPLPYQVDFSDASQFTTSWDWDFGDGTTDTQQNPTHTYAGPGSFQVTLIAQNGCATDSLTFDINLLPSGLVESNLAPLSLYPNPNSGTATLSGVHPPFWIKVLNAQGQDVSESVKMEKTGTDTYQLKARRLPAGLYHLEVFRLEGRVVHKWLIER